MESGQLTGGKTIKGEVLRIEDNDCLIKGQDGKEVRLHIEVAGMIRSNSRSNIYDSRLMRPSNQTCDQKYLEMN
jgi:hypothetical protein